MTTVSLGNMQALHEDEGIEDLGQGMVLKSGNCAENGHSVHVLLWNTIFVHISNKVMLGMILISYLQFGSYICS